MLRSIGSSQRKSLLTRSWMAYRYQSSTPANSSQQAATSSGSGSKYTDPDMKHFRFSTTTHPLANQLPSTSKIPHAEWSNPIVHQVWTEAEVNGVQRTHRPARGLTDYVAYTGVKVLRVAIDLVSGYYFGRLTDRKILRRVLFLETTAGIPGMVAGTLRHLHSLRRMKRDHGWIHTLLEEAENERMHMLVFMHRYKPGLFFRALVFLTQGVFWNIFFLSYLVSPTLCHRFVGYLEEEAVRTYTHIIDVMNSKDPRDANVVKFGDSKADEIAIRYWKLKTDATMRDVMYAVRMDEANHRDVNHTFASIKRSDVNPHLKQ